MHMNVSDNSEKKEKKKKKGSSLPVRHSEATAMTNADWIYGGGKWV